jgi:hypothetical protein
MNGMRVRQAARVGALCPEHVLRFASLMGVLDSLLEVPRMKNLDGLEMMAFNDCTKAACHRIHAAFLNRHEIESWPCSMTIERVSQGTVYNKLPEYKLTVQCGQEPGQILILEEMQDPESGPRVFLEERLDQWLEASYATQEAVGAV